MNEIQQQRDNLRERGSALGRAIDIYFEPAPQLREMLSMLVVCPRNGFTSPACTRRDRRNPGFRGDSRPRCWGHRGNRTVNLF